MLTNRDFLSKYRSGQALVSLLFTVAIGITITSAAAVILLNNITASSKYEQGTTAFYIAESGLENGLLRLLRNPNYSGETLAIGEGTAVTQVFSGNPITLVSTGTFGNAVRKIQAEIVYNGIMFTISSWIEVY